MSVQSKADVARGVVHAVVEIAVPPAKVYRALTDPKELLAWWGSPDTYRTTEWKVDLRVGGKWSSAGKGQDGKAFSVEGEYLTLDPPRLIECTWRPSWESSLATKIRYELAAIPSGTRLTVVHSGFGDRAAACNDHTQGWTRVLGWLAEHAAKA